MNIDQQIATLQSEQFRLILNFIFHFQQESDFKEIATQYLNIVQSVFSANSAGVYLKKDSNYKLFSSVNLSTKDKNYLEFEKFCFDLIFYKSKNQILFKNVSELQNEFDYFVNHDFIYTDKNKPKINFKKIADKLGSEFLFLPLVSFENSIIGFSLLTFNEKPLDLTIEQLSFLTAGLVSALEKINHIETKEKLLRLENAVLKQNYYSSLGHLAAGVAHFVKNSLFNIKGRAGILMKNKNKNEKEYELLETIYRRSLDTERVVNDLLRFAKRDNSTSENSEFDLKSLISSVVDLFNEEFRLKNIVLVKKFCSDAVLLSGNEFAIKECFINLLKNAIEAITQSGNIAITVTQIQNNIVVSLSNNGIQIDDADQKKIFDPFFTTKANSSGIGLFETRKTIDEHGGSIELTESNDRQTVFTIKLPKFLKQD